MNPFRFIVSFVVLSLSVGCSDWNEPPVEEILPPAEETTTFVSVEQATDALCEFMELLGAQTRSGRTRRIAEVVTLGGFAETRAAGSTQDEPLVYLFNFADDEGFALVSGDSRVGDVLAFVEEGNLDPEVGTDNPGFAIFLSYADTYYRLKTGLPVYDADGDLVVVSDGDDGYDPDIDEDYVEYSDWYDSYEWGQKIPCQWGQGNPLNEYCPSINNRLALAGCVAIAVAQIMYQHGYNYTYDGTAYDWDIIRNFRYRNDYTQESAVMAAKLVADLGRPENLDMNYGVSGSGAYSINVPRTFCNFGYTSVDAIQFLGNIGTSVRQRRPVYIEGFASQSANKYPASGSILGIAATRTVYTDGHAWVIDTILEQKRNIYTYRYDGVLLKTEYENRSFVHCNWGWWGDKDGYYFSNVFDTTKGPVLVHAAEYPYYYQYYLRMITNIHP